MLPSSPVMSRNCKCQTVMAKMHVGRRCRSAPWGTGDGFLVGVGVERPRASEAVSLPFLDALGYLQRKSCQNRVTHAWVH